MSILSPYLLMAEVMRIKKGTSGSFYPYLQKGFEATMSYDDHQALLRRLRNKAAKKAPGKLFGAGVKKVAGKLIVVIWIIPAAQAAASGDLAGCASELPVVGDAMLGYEVFETASYAAIDAVEDGGALRRYSIVASTKRY